MSAPFLFVIARWDAERYEFIRKHFAGEADVEVVFDRRVEERRVGRGSGPRSRRWGDRRQRDVTRDLGAVGWAYIRRRESEQAVAEAG